MDTNELTEATRELIDLETEKKTFNADMNARIKELRERIKGLVKEK